MISIGYKRGPKGEFERVLAWVTKLTDCQNFEVLVPNGDIRCYGDNLGDGNYV